MLADTLPGGTNIKNIISAGQGRPIADLSLSGLVSGFLGLGLGIAGLVMIVWALIGVFQYIVAGGNKESLAKARGRITWAIAGFILVLASFSVNAYIQGLLGPQNKIDLNPLPITKP